MGRTTVSIAGAMPSVFDVPLWEAWANVGKAAREAYCPLARSVTYYVDWTGGSDAADGLSPATALKTLGAAQTKVDARAGDTAVLLKRGEVWRTLATGAVGCAFRLDNNETLGAYGTGDLPTLFANAQAGGGRLTSGWALDVSGAYSIAPGFTPGWVMLASSPYTLPLVRLASAAAVAAQGPDAAKNIAGSWYYSAGTLYVNIGADPNGTPIDIIESNIVSGVTLRGDGSRVEGIRAVGYGCSASNTSPNQEPFHSETSGENLLKDCEAWYGGSHVVGHLQGTGSDGVLTCIGVTAGFAKYNVSSETVYNFYAQNGGHEGWLWGCTAYGTLPSSDWNWATETRAQAFYAHTFSGATFGRFFAAIDLSCPGDRYPVNWDGTPGGAAASVNPRVGTNISVVHLRTSVAAIAQLTRGRAALYIPQSYALRVHGTYYIRPWGAMNQAVSSPWTGGLLGCAIYVDLRQYAWNFGGQFALVNTASGADHTGYMEHCYVEVTHASAGPNPFYINYDLGVATAFNLRGNVFSKVPAASTFSLLTSSAEVSGNAYWQVSNNATTGSGQDTSPVLLAGAPSPGAAPPPSSPLYRAGDADTVYLVDPDGNYLYPEAPDIGPWQNPYAEPEEPSRRRRLRLHFEGRDPRPHYHVR
jgi:hypothetical protein